MIIEILMVIMVIIYMMGIPIPMYSFQPLNYLLRTFFHANSIHIIMNMITLWQLRQMNQVMSETELTQMIIFLWIFSSLILYSINTVFPSTKTITIGFSGVLMGMILVFEYMISNKNLFNVFSKLLILLVPQLLVPHISFIGHVSGLISGILWLLLFPK